MLVYMKLALGILALALLAGSGKADFDCQACACDKSLIINNAFHSPDAADRAIASVRFHLCVTMKVKP